MVYLYTEPMAVNAKRRKMEAEGLITKAKVDITTSRKAAEKKEPSQGRVLTFCFAVGAKSVKKQPQISSLIQIQISSHIEQIGFIIGAYRR